MEREGRRGEVARSAQGQRLGGRLTEQAQPVASQPGPELGLGPLERGSEQWAAARNPRAEEPRKVWPMLAAEEGQSVTDRRQVPAAGRRRGQSGWERGQLAERLAGAEGQQP